LDLLLIPLSTCLVMFFVVLHIYIISLYSITNPSAAFRTKINFAKCVYITSEIMSLEKIPLQTEAAGRIKISNYKENRKPFNSPTGYSSTEL